jgi:hypothetical protein
MDIRCQREALTAITELFNHLLSGTTDMAQLLDSIVVFIPKTSPGEYRPLGIGDAWYRLVGRANKVLPCLVVLPIRWGKNEGREREEFFSNVFSSISPIAQIN